MLVAAGFAGLAFLAGVVVFVGLVVALPASYFAEHRHLWVDRHPVVRWTGIVAKNLLGLAIVAFGILLALPGVPGQGLLTILIGLTLLDFPGKHRLVLRFIRRPHVIGSLNQLRAWFRRPPFVVEC